MSNPVPLLAPFLCGTCCSTLLSCFSGACLCQNATSSDNQPEATWLLREKVGELAGLIMRSVTPDEATQFAVNCLEREIRYRSDLLLGRRRAEALRLPSNVAREEEAERTRLALLEEIWEGRHPA